MKRWSTREAVAIFASLAPERLPGRLGALEEHAIALHDPSATSAASSGREEPPRDLHEHDIALAVS